MKIFTIHNETDKIAIHASAREAGVVANADQFRSEASLAKLAAGWPASRLIRIWNSLPGVKKVTRFKDRATGIARIWRALQILPEPAARPDPRHSKKTHGATNTGAPREGSKTSRVVAMLRRPGGATLEEIMTEMGWQKHTTRAMLSAGGALTKNYGLIITSTKTGKEHTYSLKA
jgi:hypothetical protein